MNTEALNFSCSPPYAISMSWEENTNIATSSLILTLQCTNEASLFRVIKHQAFHIDT